MSQRTKLVILLIEWIAVIALFVILLTACNPTVQFYRTTDGYCFSTDSVVVGASVDPTCNKGTHPTTTTTAPHTGPVQCTILTGRPDDC